MRTIALATCHEESNLYYDEAPLVAALAARGYAVKPVVWNSPEINWASYDVVAVRNTWDYHTQAVTFRLWLNLLDSIQIPVVNPTALLRWGIDKTYLQALSEQGIRILPTLFAQNRELQLETIFDEYNWDDFLVKPIISASGENTWRVNRQNIAKSQQRFAWLNQQIGMMIQPIAPQIQAEGEYSLVFFDGVFSHAVLKKPPQDSLFVHEEKGGTIDCVDVSHDLRADARQAILVVEKLTGIMPHYARVDGVRDDDGFILMEMECIEPELYFTRYAHAAEQFAEVIVGAMS